ncbi:MULTISPECIES: hypothetical protein [Vibrio]|uniref:Uncharacterized protein n=1 Tax=Vibrio algivorus TaxID=1667024 RepID=A0ABQ6EPE5_9VIBR|nr:hypothetical protein [Vibrio algivorus]GLT15008.1 hypothetical protein GCM10007931_19830 [Vibrio algivorus]
MNNNFDELAMDLNNWIPAIDVPKQFPQFTHAQIKNLIWKREHNPALNRCYRRVGRKGYINAPLFGLFMAGMLPEQRGEHNA